MSTERDRRIRRLLFLPVCLLSLELLNCMLQKLSMKSARVRMCCQRCYELFEKYATFFLFFNGDLRVKQAELC